MLGASALALVLSAGLAETASARNTFQTIHPATFDTSYTFTTLDDKNETTPVDPNFNQLLGINNGNVIVGYDGDGTKKPNKGYVLVPSNHYSGENFPDSAQTQVIGINSGLFPTTVGFWIDGNGNNFGFTNHNGVFIKVRDPNTGTFGGIQTNQLLGINNHDIAVGFYLDSNGNSHGYEYNVGTKAFTEISLGQPTITSFQITGINDSGVLVGSASTSTATFGFFGSGATFQFKSVTNSNSLTFFGINNAGIVVGAATVNGESVGIVYDTKTNKAAVVNDTLATATPAFGVTGTTINGINDNNDIVGFFSDGKKVHGFLAVPK
jgi:hypothetical protein